MLKNSFIFGYLTISFLQAKKDFNFRICCLKLKINKRKNHNKSYTGIKRSYIRCCKVISQWHVCMQCDKDITY